MPIETLYLIHHSHTDIGFTGDQPMIWELHARILSQALDQIEREVERYGADQSIRWTLESAAVLDYWLDHTDDREIERFIAAERAGLVEVTALPFNLTPLYDQSQYLEMLQSVQRLRREYGVTIDSAMNCDVNGQNWPLADLLIDAGMRGFSMAINHHFGGPPTPRPALFRWQAPSGRFLPTLNGWQYNKATEFGMADSDPARFREWWPRAERYLRDVGYPLTSFMIQGIHPYGDNAGIYQRFGEFARRWNAAGHTPQIVLATPRQWWRAVHADLARLPIWHGDWTDYWNFGCISTAREQAVERAARARLVRADALYAGLHALPATTASWAARSFTQYRARGWEALNRWGEHTWCVDGAGGWWRDDSRSQSVHKAIHAYTAHTYSTLLQRDALADFTRHVARAAPDDLCIFNPLPWARTISGPISPFTLAPRGEASDSLAGRHYQDHFAEPTGIGAHQSTEHVSLLPTDVPAYGYALVPRQRVINTAREAVASDAATIEHPRYQIRFDRERGGICSLYDRQLAHEWVDQTATYRLGTVVHEAVADRAHPVARTLLNAMDWQTSVETKRAWQPEWRALRCGAEQVLSHTVYHTRLGWSVEQVLEHPALGQITQRVFVPAERDEIVYEAQWQMGLETHPEASYVLFPFNLPQATARIDLGGLAVRPEADQLPGVNRDYFTVQQWVDFSDGERGITIATPINPMVQLGDFHFAHNQTRFTLPQATFLGWVTNNYWECNFPYHQPGTVIARYHLQPYSGDFSEPRAHRFGHEAVHAAPLVQHLGEAPRTPTLPPAATLLHLPSEPIQTIHVRAGSVPQTLLLRLLNSSDDTHEALIRSGVLRIIRAWACDLFDQPQAELAVVDDGLRVALPARRVAVIGIEVQLN